jgi:hypothetical protein
VLHLRSGRLTPERAAAAVAALACALALWNALADPPGAGYDAASHKQYADFLIQHLRLPVRNEPPEYYAGVSVRTVSKWRRRYRVEGEQGLFDRCSAPWSVPSRTDEARVAVIAALRRLRMTGAEIAETLAMPV